MLRLIRRHLSNCPHRAKGVKFLKCQCPIHIHGTLNGKTIRRTADTRNMERAEKVLRKMELGEIDPTKRNPVQTVEQAVHAFMTHRCRDVVPNTRRKYANALRQFSDFCRRAGRLSLDEVTVPDLDEFGTYRRGTTLGALAWSKELPVLRTFFGWCMKRGYARANPAREVDMPKNPEPEREIVPYTRDEIVRILAACDTFGRTPYERLRARAMILVMRHTALAISDTARLKRSQVIDGPRIRLDRGKTGKPIHLPIPYGVVQALNRLPVPRGTPASGTPYFFWNGVIGERALIGSAERTMAAVFAESGVPNAGTHRFRHTLATELLERGATFEDVAAVLGNTAKVVEKHYAKWSKGRQDRLDGLLGAVQNSTPTTQESVYTDNQPVFTKLNWCGEGDLNPHGVTR